MEIHSSMKTTLKRLRLSPILHTLPDRIAYARKSKLSHQDFLELVLQDEIDRREHKSLQLRIDKAGFTEERTLEGFDWDAPITFDRDRVRDLFSLGFLDRHEDAIFMGPVGVGKSHLAEALGHGACRAGKQVLFCRADELFKEFLQSRADHSTSKTLRRYLAPHLLIIDDFALRRLDARQSSDIYEVIIGRHKQASTIFTSNRTVEEWIPHFDDPMLAQSALDRLAHNAHQVVIEGESYRKRQAPGARPPQVRRGKTTPKNTRNKTQ
ncbi:MAG: IS21-like element helper ATPase IstB [Deltaproteobacteria bacterium]|nr:IS21-like element helper ATPase IstB [Deltaproteobacteria bacterium]